MNGQTPPPSVPPSPYASQDPAVVPGPAPGAQRPPGRSPGAPRARRGRRVPTAVVVGGAVVVLLAAAGGGFVFGAVRAGADIAASAAESAREGRADGTPAVVDGADPGAEAEAAEGTADPGRADLGGPRVAAAGITFGVPAGWEPLESLPPDMSMTADGPDAETAHALTRPDGTIVAYTSVITARGTVTGGSADLATLYQSLFGSVSGTADVWDEEAVSPHDVPGSPDTTRVDLRFSPSLHGSMLVVDTGAPTYTMLFAVVNESVAATEEETGDAVVDAVLASVSVL